MNKIKEEFIYMKTNQGIGALAQETESKSQVITDKAVRSMADAIYKHLQGEGCQPKDIINVSSQLLGLLTTEIARPE